jgi:hypothetical protein
MKEFATHFVSDSNKIEWRPLFDGYSGFYKTKMTDIIADDVWTWLVDPNHVWKDC